MQALTQNQFLLKRNIMLTGAISSLIFAIVYILAGIDFTGYVISANPADQLNSSDIFIIIVLLFVYDILLLIFGLAIYVQFSEKNLLKMRITGILFIVLAVLGIISLVFPSNINNLTAIDNSLTILQFLVTVALLIFIGLGLLEVFHTSIFLIISFVVLVILIITTAIGVFLVWVAVVSYMLYKQDMFE